jgi:anaerobic magnesium-protoporphyrin IX monomethyl ester cyclase
MVGRLVCRPVEILEAVEMILLLNPPGKELHQRSSRWGGRKNRSGIVAPPIFLATAASVLRERGIQARVMDAAAEGRTWEWVMSWIEENKPGMVVLEVSTTSIDSDSETAAELKKMGMIVVFVGTHVTALPEETLRNYAADFLCIGEYEFTLPELWEAVGRNKPLGGVRGIAYRSGGDVVVTERRELRDINDFPIPAYDQLPVRMYYDPVARNQPWMAIRSMRGCPFGCTYCVAPRLMYNRTVRLRDPKKVVDEMELLMKRFGIREFFIDDETFTISRKHVSGVCGEIKRRGMKVDWVVFSRCDTIDEGVIKELKSAGCYMIKYGLESADQRILDKAEKGLRVNQIIKAFRITKKNGVRIHATVMLGLEGETEETLRKTLGFVKKLSPDYVQYAIATPYPGTKWYDSLEARGMILTRKWGDYDGSCRSLVRLDGISNKRLEQLVDVAYKDFYMRPGFLIRKILSMRSLGEIYHAAKSGVILMRSF